MSPVTPPPDAEGSASDDRRRLSVTPPLAGPEMHDILDIRRGCERTATSEIGPGEAALVDVPADSFVRVLVLQQPQVGEIRLWDRHDLSRRFSRDVTRQRVGAHLSLGDQLVSGDDTPATLATVSGDSVQWFGYDNDGAGVNDLIGSPCDYRSSPLVTDLQVTQTCRGSIAASLAAATGGVADEMYPYVGDGLGLFVCSGFDHKTGDYFTSPTPARGGDYLELFAHRDLLVGISACPVGDGTQPGDVSRHGRLRIDIISPES